MVEIVELASSIWGTNLKSFYQIQTFEWFSFVTLSSEELTFFIEIVYSFFVLNGMTVKYKNMVMYWSKRQCLRTGIPPIVDRWIVGRFTFGRK